jgi:hypothetical protein
MKEVNVNELRHLGYKLAKERFPELNLTPEWVYWSGGIFRYTMWADNRLAVGIGETMNECCDRLIEDIERITSPEYELEMMELL